MHQLSLSRRRSTTMIFGLLLLVLGLLVAAGGVAVLRSLSMAQAARHEGRMAAEVVETARGLLANLSFAESAQRGFLLTGREGYLSPYDAARQGALGSLARLDALAEVPGERLEALAPLRGLAEAKLDEMTETLRLSRAGRRDAAIALVTSDTGERLMRDLRLKVEAMLAIEYAALEASDRQMAQAQQRLFRQLGMLVVAATAALILAATALRGSAQRAARIRYLSEIERQRDRADLVRRELSHRVKNLFAVIMSIISTTARTESDPREAARKTRERVQALARAHSLSSGETELRSAELGELVAAVAGPYAPPGQDLATEGPSVPLPSAMVTPLGLILNELATNALKYGGWSQAAGTVRVAWKLTGPNQLQIRWEERGAEPPAGPPKAQAKGFGTVMIDLSADQAGASVERHWERDGITVVIDLLLTPDRKGG